MDNKLRDFLLSMFTKEELEDKGLLFQDKLTDKCERHFKMFFNPKKLSRKDLEDVQLVNYTKFVNAIFNPTTGIKWRIIRADGKAFTVKTSSTEAMIKLTQKLNEGLNFDRLVKAAIKYYSAPDISTKTLANWLVDDAYVIPYGDTSDEEILNNVKRDKIG